MISDTLYDGIRRALNYVASRCDYAQAADRVGFSGCDTFLGHALSEKEPWLERELMAAARLAVKYQKQWLGVIPLDLSEVKTLLSSRPKVAQIKKNDVITGKIWSENNLFYIRTNHYNKKVHEVARSLMGSDWDKASRVWTADFCCENAADIEFLAKEFALPIYKTAEWENFQIDRQVKIEGNDLIINGISNGSVRSIIKETSADNTNNSDVSFGYYFPDTTSLAIPMNSWNIGNFLVWLNGLEESSHLSWAIDRCTELLAGQDELLRQRESENYSRVQSLAVPDDIRDALASTLPHGFVEKLMPHQLVGIQCIAEHNQMILADQQGLGKTLQILGALELTNAYPAIVVAPATALMTWRDEVAKWLPHRKVAVLGSRIKKADMGVPPADADIVILNYEIFGKEMDCLAAIRPATLVADEAQYLKGYNSARTKAIRSFCQDKKVGRIIASTGTPIMNRPSELLTILQLLPNMLAELGGFWWFAKRYCAAIHRRYFSHEYWDFSGAQNLQELAKRIRETGRFVRREKAATLKDLPAKQYDFLQVLITNRDEYEKAAQDFSEWLRTVIKTDKKKHNDDDSTQLQMAAKCLLMDEDDEFHDLDHIYIASQQDRADALRRLTALRQLVGTGKIADTVVAIRNIVKDEKQKLVVFAYHLEVQQALIEALTADGQKPLSITGAMNLSERHKAIHTFQHDTGARVIICSLKAAQTAITLSAAKRAIMVELDWTPGVLDQAEDRIHRIGQTYQVLITYLIAKDTLDQRMAKILELKRTNINKVTGTALHGFKKDGKPRMQAPGPGRRPLPAAERKARRAGTKALWQAKNLDKMRNTMRERRKKEKIRTARIIIEEYRVIRSLGYAGMLRELREQPGRYRLSDYERDVTAAYQAALKAQAALKKLGIEEVIDAI